MEETRTPSTTPRHAQAVFWLIAATAVWGLSFPIIKLLHLRHSAEQDTRVLSCWILVARCWLSALILAAWKPSMLRGITRNEWIQSLGLIGFGGIGLLFQADGLASTEASTSAFLTQFYCVLLPLWTCLRLRRRPARKIIICTLLVLVGMAILSKLTWENLHLGVGEWKTIVAACFFTGQILLLEQPRHAENRGATITILALAGTGVVGLCFAVPMTHEWSHMLTLWTAGPDLTLLLILTLGCTLFSYLMMNQWQKHVSATEAGLIYCMEPVFTAVYVLFLPGVLSVFASVNYENESITSALLVGGGLVTLANLLLQRK
jgi:drug/metabolite transporter (DMT)-like permease